MRSRLDEDRIIKVFPTYSKYFDAVQDFLDAVEQDRKPSDEQVKVVAYCLRRWLNGLSPSVAFENQLCGWSDTKRREFHRHWRAAEAVCAEMDSGKTRHVARQSVAEQMDVSFDFVKKADERLRKKIEANRRPRKK